MSQAQFNPIVELTRSRIVEFWREKEAVFWTFGFPLILALVLGIAFRSKPVDLPRIAVLGDTPAAVALRGLVSQQGWPTNTMDAAQADLQFRRGRLDLLIGFQNPEGQPIFRYDRSRPEGRIAFLEAERLLKKMHGDAGQPVREDGDPLPGSRYIDFLIPGLIGLNFMGSGMWGVGYSITVARMNKVLKVLAATPMKRSHYLLSYLISRLILLVPEVLVLMAASWLLFGVRVRGSWSDLLVISILGGFAFVGLGMLTAVRARTVESISGWMNLVMLPMWVLSGALFSYERFPEVFHPFIRALPLTAVTDALRMMMIDGMPLRMVWLEATVLLVWCLATFWGTWRFFRWQ
jgi:ABC-type polysaccharide/polyol phosphate export permease